MGPQAWLWYGVAVGSGLFGLWLLVERYVRREERAVRSRGGATLFAVFMVIFAVGAAVAGYAATQAGR